MDASVASGHHHALSLSRPSGPLLHRLHHHALVPRVSAFALAFSLAASGLGSGCSLFDDCGQLEGQASIVVRVAEARTGQPVSDEVEVLARDGDFAETLEREGDRYSGIPNRPGTYAVTASGDGYEAASAEARADAYQCGGRTFARTAFVDIALSPAAP